MAALVAKYEGDGYSRPQVRVDDALLELGVLRIDVFEPRIAEVKITGDPGPHLARLEHLARELRAASVVRQAGSAGDPAADARAAGLSLAATTARDLERRTSIGSISTRSSTRSAAAVRLSNRGTDEAGPNFVLGQVDRERLARGQTQPRRDVRRSDGL